MSNYYCVCCDYDAKVKSSFDKHLKTKKHIRAMESHPKTTEKSPLSHPKVTNLDESNSHQFQCHYCSKNFKFKQSMYKHMKYNCKDNPNGDFDKFKSIIKAKDKVLNCLLYTSPSPRD